jgi:hypothetical protein
VSSATISLLVLAAVIVAFVVNKLPVTVVALLTALSLYAFGVLDLTQALAGFGDPSSSSSRRCSWSAKASTRAD